MTWHLQYFLKHSPLRTSAGLLFPTECCETIQIKFTSSTLLNIFIVSYETFI